MNTEPSVNRAADIFACPIGTCEWRLTVPRRVLYAEAAELEQYTTHVETALREHCDTHTSEDWVRALAELREQLAAAQAAPLICLSCHVQAYNARTAKMPEPPIHPVQIIVNGAGVCLDHLQIQGPGSLIVPPGTRANGS